MFKIHRYIHVMCFLKILVLYVNKLSFLSFNHSQETLVHFEYTDFKKL